MNVAVATVRAASVDDAEAITRLLTELGYPTEPAVMRVRLAALAGRTQRRIRVADFAGQVCGWIEAEHHEPHEAEPEVEILTLVVARNVQHHGIGGLLVADIEAWARSLGSDMLAVRSSVFGNASHPFYRHLGFEHHDDDNEYVKRLLPDA